MQSDAVDRIDGMKTRTRTMLLSLDESEPDEFE